jgi:hypothetical protein
MGMIIYIFLRIVFFLMGVINGILFHNKTKFFVMVINFH